jgi:hypothetical protein
VHLRFHDDPSYHDEDNGIDDEDDAAWRQKGDVIEIGVAVGDHTPARKKDNELEQ